MMALLMLLGIAVVACAQGGVGSTRGLPSTSGGINTIQGQVFFPGSSQPVNKRVRVRLESATNSIYQTALTDDDGIFRFTQLEAGAYTISVDGGKEYESLVENVAIDREASSGGRILSVPLYLKLKPDPSVPKGAVDFYNKAQESVRAGNSKKAVEQLNSALALYPNFTLALAELGEQYLKLAEPQKALEVLQKAMELEPKDFKIRLNYGFALMNQKDFKGAETQLREAIKINGAAPTAHMYLGIVLVNLRNLEEAQKELETAAQSPSVEVSQAHRYLGGIYWGNHDYKRAADELETYLKLSPKAADAERTRAAVKDLRSKQ
jgi:Tfp pilus assembly protein PilF